MPPSEPALAEEIYEAGKGKGATDQPAARTAQTEAKRKEENDFIQEWVKKFDAIASAENQNRIAAIDDLKFKVGDQWPADIRAERKSDKRPALTINKVPTFVRQIVNEQRQNRPAIVISPVGDKSDQDAAKLYRGMIRHIERASDADIAYDTAFESSVDNGWGYFRILPEYEEDKSFDQVLRIKRISNPMTVYLGPHELPTGADAPYAFISDMIPKDEFTRDYPESEVISWATTAPGENMKNWVNSTHVRVAELYYQKFKDRTLVRLKNGFEGWEDELSEEIREAIAQDRESIVDDTREVKCSTWHWCKMTAHEKLDETDWPGRFVPIIKVTGNETNVEGKVHLSGVIRAMKDAQRMYNYWVTAETEQVALMPKAPYIMEEGQLEGHAKMWRDANRKNYSFLLYKGTNIGNTPAPPPQRQQFAGPPAGIVQAKQGASQDMQATSGVRFDATMQERMHDESGVAVKSLRNLQDLGSFHYIDNFGRSLRHAGVVLIDLVPHYYDTERVVTILREDDTPEQVKIAPKLDKAHGEETVDGKPITLFNPKQGKYEVTVTIGPSFATKRAEASESMLGFIKVYPAAAQFIGDLIAQNQDWPGAEQVAARLKAMLPPQLLKPDPKDIPPEAAAYVRSLEGKLNQLGQQYQALLKQMEDRTRELDIKQSKVDNDFKADVLKVVAEMEENIGNRLMEALKSAAAGAAALSATPPAGGGKPAAPASGAPPA